jgi:hypothetical protein
MCSFSCSCFCFVLFLEFPINQLLVKSENSMVVENTSCIGLRDPSMFGVSEDITGRQGIFHLCLHFWQSLANAIQSENRHTLLNNLRRNRKSRERKWAIAKESYKVLVLKSMCMHTNMLALMACFL